MEQLLKHGTDGFPADDREMRRSVTDKWGRMAFLSAIAMVLLVALMNVLLAPVFHRAINLPPAQLRKRMIGLPWLNLAMAVWSVSIVCMALVQTHGDLVWIVKRTGRLAVTLMPPLYLFILRPSPLPRTFYLQLLPMHKWLSRLVVFSAVVHGAGYAYNYSTTGKVHKLLNVENISGYVALVFFLLMALTGWSWFRRITYKVFYAIHVLGAWLVLPLIAYHSRPPCTNYILACLAILAVQVFFRIKYSARVSLRVQYVSNTLLLVDIPKECLPSWFWKWSPGAHIRLSGLLSYPLNWLRSSHPYTISSLCDEPTLQLVVRKTNYTIKMRRQYSVNGPYRSMPYYFEQQVQDKMVRRCLFVIGGSGIAFGAPLFRYLKLHGVFVKLLWAVRDPYDAKALKPLLLHQDMMEGDIEVYYTGAKALGDVPEDEQLGIDISDSCDNHGEQTNDQTRHLKKRMSTDNLLSCYTAGMYHSRPHLNLRLKSWLYGLEADSDDCCCADRLIDACEEDKLGVWVISTGAPKLVQDAKHWAQTAGVGFFEEEFTL